MSSCPTVSSKRNHVTLRDAKTIYPFWAISVVFRGFASRDSITGRQARTTHTRFRNNISAQSQIEFNHFDNHHQTAKMGRVRTKVRIHRTEKQMLVT